MLQPKIGMVFPLAYYWDATPIERMTIRHLLEHHTEVDCIMDCDILFQPYDLSVVVQEEVVVALQIS